MRITAHTLRAEFARGWSPPADIPEKKARAALWIALDNTPLKELARFVGVAYGTLRNWTSVDAGFKALVERIRCEFADALQARVEQEVRRLWTEAEESEEIPDLDDLEPLFKDRGEYADELRRELSKRAKELLRRLEQGQFEDEEEMLILADVAATLWWIAEGGERSLEDIRADWRLDVVFTYVSSWAEKLKKKIEKTTSLSEEDREELEFFLMVVADLLAPA